MTLAFLQLSGTDIVKVQTISKYLSLVEKLSYQSHTNLVWRDSQEDRRSWRWHRGAYRNAELSILLPSVLMWTSRQKKPNPTKRPTLSGVKLFICIPGLESPEESQKTTDLWDQDDEQSLTRKLGQGLGSTLAIWLHTREPHLLLTS